MDPRSATSSAPGMKKLPRDGSTGSADHVPRGDSFVYQKAVITGSALPFLTRDNFSLWRLSAGPYHRVRVVMYSRGGARRRGPRDRPSAIGTLTGVDITARLKSESL